MARTKSLRHLSSKQESNVGKRLTGSYSGKQIHRKPLYQVLTLMEDNKKTSMVEEQNVGSELFDPFSLQPRPVANLEEKLAKQKKREEQEQKLIRAHQYTKHPKLGPSEDPKDDRKDETKVEGALNKLNLKSNSLQREEAKEIVVVFRWNENDIQLPISISPTTTAEDVVKMIAHKMLANWRRLGVVQSNLSTQGIL